MKNKQHIVIDARESGSSTGTYVDNLVKYLHEIPTSVRFTILTNKKRVAFMKEIAPNFDVHATRFKEFSLGEQLGLKRQLQKLSPDLVHFGMTQQPILFRGNVVTTMHDLITIRYTNPAKNWLVFKIKQQLYKWGAKYIAKKSAAIITPTEFVKDDVARFARINSSKITVTYESADKIAAEPEPLEKVVSKDFILFVGRPQPHKNLKRLIDAFALLQKKQPKLVLVLVGKKDKAYDKLEAYAKRSNIKNIVFAGWVSEGQKLWLYQHTRVYVFPSLSEGFGLPALEAMINGKSAVASSNASCLPEVYKNAVHYFDPNDSQAISTAIDEILSDKNLAERLQARGYALAKTYSWQRMAEQTLAVYKKALGE